MKIMTNQEKEFLLLNYQKIGCKKCAEVLQIKPKRANYLAKKLKLTRKKIFNLNSEQIKKLKILSKKLSIKKIAKYFNYSAATIVRASQKYHISFNKKVILDDDQKKWLLENFQTKSYNNICKHLDISKNQLIGLIRKHKLKKKKFILNLQDIEWLKENYHKLGRKTCALHFNISPQILYRKIRILGIKYFGEVGNHIVDMSLFENIQHAEIVYFLGFFWGDGHLSVKKNSTYLTINIIKSDYEQIKNVLNKFIKWNILFTKPKNRQEQANLSLRGNRLGNFLLLNDYHIKSGASPNKILSKIPNDLKHYWWRGYLDADGCILTKTKNGVQFTSTYNQDWFFVTNLLHKFEIIKYHIRRIFKEKSKSSTIKITNLQDSKKILDFIYQNFDTNNIGLSRKYDRYQIIKRRCLIFLERKSSKFIGVDYNKKTNKWRSFIRQNGKSKCLGYFLTELEAYNARIKALNLV